MQRNRSPRLNVGVNFEDSVVVAAIAVAVASGGVVAIVVAAAGGTAITSKTIILVNIPEVAIPAAMYTFVIVVVATAADDEAYLLGFGVIRDVPRVVYATSRESRARAIP